MCAWLSAWHYELPVVNFPWEMLPFCQFIRTRFCAVLFSSQYYKISKSGFDLFVTPTNVKISLTISTVWSRIWTHMWQLCIKAWNHKNMSYGEDESMFYHTIRQYSVRHDAMNPPQMIPHSVKVFFNQKSVPPPIICPSIRCNLQKNLNLKLKMHKTYFIGLNLHWQMDRRCHSTVIHFVSLFQFSTTNRNRCLVLVNK